MVILDKDLENFIMTYKQNAMNLSNTSQNELLLYIKEYIQQEIVNVIKNEKDFFVYFFDLSADEVTDISNWEQFGIIVAFAMWAGRHSPP